MKTVVEDFESFEDVAPVLSLVVEPFIEHVHDVVKVTRSAEKLVSAHPSLHTALEFRTY